MTRARAAFNGYASGVSCGYNRRMSRNTNTEQPQPGQQPELPPTHPEDPAQPEPPPLPPDAPTPTAPVREPTSPQPAGDPPATEPTRLA